MPIVAELIDMPAEEEDYDIFSILDDQEEAAVSAQPAETVNNTPPATANSAWDDLLDVLGDASTVTIPAAKTSSKKRKKKENVVIRSLFDLLKEN